MNLVLPNTKLIKIRDGIDRYGYSHILAKKLGFKYPPRSFANWIHGWVWAENPTSKDLMCYGFPKDLTIVTRNIIERDALVSEGFGDVRVGGLPFCYVEKQHYNRVQDSLIAFPHHDTEREKSGNHGEKYFKWLASIKKDFSHVYVSLHYCNIGGPMEKAALDNGLNVIQGARPDDANSMLRVRSLLDSFEYATTNILGSHILYAGFSGCKVSICGPYFDAKEDILNNVDLEKDTLEYVEKVVTLHSEIYARQKFTDFFKSHPKMGINNSEYFFNMMGCNHVMNNTEIIEALKWKRSDQIYGYFSGAKRRLTRSIKKWI